MNPLLAAIELTAPTWLLALLAAAPLAWSGRPTSGSRLQRFGVVLLRFGALASLALALAGLHSVWQSQCKFVVCAIDESDSLGTPARKTADAWLAEADAQQGEHRIQRLPFAETADTRQTLPIPAAVRRHTNLEAALIVARAAIPDDYVPQIVLLSDGHENMGHVQNVLGDLGVPVSVVPLPGMDHDEVQVLHVSAREPARVRRAHDVQVAIESAGDNAGELVLSIEQQVLARQKVQLKAGENRLQMAVVFPKAGEFLLRTELVGFRDGESRNNAWTVPLVVEPEPRILVVENPPGAAARLTTALKTAEFDITVRSGPEPGKLLNDVRAFGLVILANVPAATTREPWMERLAEAVRKGNSLLVIGGRQAFTPGGYPKSVLEDLLPLQSTVREESHGRDLAMAVLIDCSESMKEKQRMVLAKEATRRVVENLRSGDQLGVLAYEDASTWIVPLGPCNDKARTIQQIDTIEALGRTNMLPAMERAWLALRECFATHKHVLVLTDGVSHMGDFRRAALQLAASGITISTVAVGEEPARAVLEEIARVGRGRFYDCPDAAAVPRVFALETLGAGRRGISEGSLLVSAANQAPLPANLPAAGWPALLGCCQTTTRPGAQLLLTLSSGDPLLAGQILEKGRSMAFTADLQPDWGAAWIEWPEFDRFWTAVVRDLLPPLASRPGVAHQLRTENYPDELRLAPTNRSLLETIARSTGGRYNVKPAEVFASDGRSVARTTPFRCWLLLAALTCWLGQVVLRRM